MYFIAKPDLIRAAQKQHKILAFPPIIAKFSTKVCGTSPHAQKVLDANAYSDQGDSGVTVDVHDAMDAALRPGAHLDDMNRDMLSASPRRWMTSKRRPSRRVRGWTSMSG